MGRCRNRDPLTQQYLRAVISYDPATGEFVWAANRGQRQMAGRPAGYISKDGYRYIYVNGRDYLAHRLAWLYVHGVMPAALVDHVNRDRSDNRISNLRLASRSQNAVNTDIPRAGVGVVVYARKRFTARIKVNGRKIHLGNFDTEEEAFRAYDAARRKHFGEFVP